MTLKYLVLERKDPMKWGMRAIPWYLAFTAGVLALFIIDELPNGESLEDMGAGKATGIILGVFFFVLAFAYAFFIPYFHRRLIMNDARMRPWHIPLGLLLYREDPPIYWPGKGTQVVTDYYAKSSVETTTNDVEKVPVKEHGADQSLAINEAADTTGDATSSSIDKNSITEGTSDRAGRGLSMPNPRGDFVSHVIPKKPEPEERWLHPVRDLPFYSPKKIANWTKFLLLQGVSRDVVTQKNLGAVHARAIVYDNRVEHLYTYAQVASAMMMSIAHGSNDVANAVGPWVASYNTYTSGEVTAKADTPIWVSGSTATMSCARSATRSLKCRLPVVSPWSSARLLLFCSRPGSDCPSRLRSVLLARRLVLRFATMTFVLSIGSRLRSSSRLGSLPCRVRV
jgi:phosphate/sulfate permease